MKQHPPLLDRRAKRLLERHPQHGVGEEVGIGQSPFALEHEPVLGVDQPDPARLGVEKGQARLEQGVEELFGGTGDLRPRSQTSERLLNGLGKLVEGEVRLRHGWLLRPRGGADWGRGGSQTRK